MSKKINPPKFGEVYLAKFHPAYGEEFKKFRPTVILNNKTNQIDKRFVLVAPLTSKTKNLKEYEIFVPKNSFLNKDSAIITWYLYTMDVDRLELKLGELSPKIKEEIKQEVTEYVSS